MVNDQVKLIIQLVVAEEGDHIFFKEYDRDYSNIFAVQSEVAQTIAREIEIALTPEEKQLIEKLPTQSLTAYDYYLKGQEEYQKYWANRDIFNLGISENLFKLDNAEGFFNKALEYDSSFARAYSGLAQVYWYKYPHSDNSTREFSDTVINLADIALSFDDELADAYTIKGDYYREIGNREQAEKEYDRAIDLNPNDWMAYRGKGYLCRHEDYVMWIDNLEKAAFLNQGPELPTLLRELWLAYFYVGFEEKGMSYQIEALKRDNDSLELYFALVLEEGYVRGNFNKALELARKAYEIDSTDNSVLGNMGYCLMLLGQNKEALKYMQRWFDINQGNLAINYMHRFGYVYWENGLKEEADTYFDKLVEYSTKEIESGRRSLPFGTYYDLAGTYAFRGEKDKAYENLRLFNQRRVMHKYIISLIHIDPLFNGIRDEPEFQQIVRDMEAKYQAEHERVRQWLEENDML